MIGWPDPGKPGVPLTPERDGRHWLFDAESNVSFPELWVAGMGAWAVGDAWTPRIVAEMGLHYQGPVLMPAEADDLKDELTLWKEVCYGFQFDLESARAENARLRAALIDLLDDAWVRDFGEWFEDRLKQARAALDPDGQKERREKALSDLAEMDADLLDIDPEMKP